MSDVDAIWDALDTFDEAFGHTDPPECASKAREQLRAQEEAVANARNEALEEAAMVLLGHRNNALAAKRAMTTDIMRTKWDGVAEALDDMAETVRAMKR